MRTGSSTRTIGRQVPEVRVRAQYCKENPAAQADHAIRLRK
jgi:hypothetical protein